MWGDALGCREAVAHTPLGGPQRCESLGCDAAATKAGRRERPMPIAECGVRSVD